MAIVRRESAGLSPDELAGGRTALLLVDVQEAFESAVAGAFPDWRARTGRLLQSCRGMGPHRPAAPELPGSSGGHGVLVVHVRANYVAAASSPWIPYFAELFPEGVDDTSSVPAPIFAAGAGELVVHKPTFDAFTYTDLEQQLREHQIEQTLVCGVLTSACVLFTAHGCFARGFRPVIVEDCCADRSREVHETVLGLYGGYMFKIASSGWLSQPAAGVWLPVGIAQVIALGLVDTDQVESGEQELRWLCNLALTDSTFHEVRCGA